MQAVSALCILPPFLPCASSIPYGHDSLNRSSPSDGCCWCCLLTYLLTCSSSRSLTKSPTVTRGPLGPLGWISCTAHSTAQQACLLVRDVAHTVAGHVADRGACILQHLLLLCCVSPYLSAPLSPPYHHSRGPASPTACGGLPRSAGTGSQPIVVATAAAAATNKVQSSAVVSMCERFLL